MLDIRIATGTGGLALVSLILILTQALAALPATGVS